MKDFNRSEPAILHDQISDTIVTWSGEEANAFRCSHVQREDGTTARNGFVFDGWGNSAWRLENRHTKRMVSMPGFPG
jgi:hypothetical protein